VLATRLRAEHRRHQTSQRQEAEDEHGDGAHERRHRHREVLGVAHANVAAGALTK
jgi:hypothetical protein